MKLIVDVLPEDGQTVDEQAHVQSKLRFVAAVPQLPGDRESVLRVSCGGCWVSGRRRAVEQVEVVILVLQAVAQKVDGAALRDLTLQAG